MKGKTRFFCLFSMFFGHTRPVLSLAFLGVLSEENSPGTRAKILSYFFLISWARGVQSHPFL